MTQFKKPLHKISNYLRDKKSLTAALNYIFFKDGFVWASNGFVLVRQALSEHGFSKEESILLEGKVIHRDIFAKIWKDSPIRIEENSIIGISKTLYPLQNPKEIGVTPIDYGLVLDTSLRRETQELTTVFLDLGSLVLINQVSFKPVVKLLFTGLMTAIIANSEGLVWEQEVFLIMPTGGV